MNIAPNDADSFQQEEILVLEDLWQEDEASVNELGIFDRRSSKPPEPRAYDPNLKQILSEKTQSDPAKFDSTSTFRLRIEKVDFGSFENQSACRIVLAISFSPKNSVAWRFRDATIRAHVQPGDGSQNPLDDKGTVIPSPHLEPYLKVAA